MHPAYSLRHDAWSSINECINAEMAQFMTAGRYEQNVAYGLRGRSVRMSSSQQAMPPPRSLAHEYQPLRGVITISGSSAALRPSIFAVTLNEVVATRFTDAIR